MALDHTGARRLGMFALAIALTAMLAAGVFMGLGWHHTNETIKYNQEQSNHKFCGLLQLLVQPDSHTPRPTTPRSRAIAQALKDLADDFGCNK